MLRLMLILLGSVGVIFAASCASAGERGGPRAGYQDVQCEPGHWVWTGGWGLLGPGWGYYLTPDYYYVPGRCYVPEDVIDYCMRRFKSYDPRSGTYLGYDGRRHPCP